MPIFCTVSRGFLSPKHRFTYSVALHREGKTDAENYSKHDTSCGEGTVCFRREGTPPKFAQVSVALGIEVLLKIL